MGCEQLLRIQLSNWLPGNPRAANPTPAADSLPGWLNSRASQTVFCGFQADWMLLCQNDHMKLQKLRDPQWGEQMGHVDRFTTTALGCILTEHRQHFW